MSKNKNSKVFLDIAYGTEPAGRVIFELFSDITPRTAENFRGLCTGEYENIGLGIKTKALHYINSNFHRIIDGFVLQGGDITHGDGSGGHSIYGANFNDENFQRRHACAGLLSMANRGRNTNSSQFFVTLKACPHLDGKHTVFGQVIDGMDVIRKISKVPVDMRDKPRVPVTIVNCGEIDSARDFLTMDPFKSHGKQLELQKKMERGEIISNQQEENQSENEIMTEKEKKVEEIPEEVLNIDSLAKKAKPAQINRLMELKLKINEAKVMNNKAVLEEEKAANDPHYEQNLKRQLWKERQQSYKEDLEFKGIKSDKTYLNDTATKIEKKFESKSKKTESFGWDVFNEDTLYRSYKKRCTDMPFYKDLYEQQMEKGEVDDGKTNDERLQNMVDDLENQKAKRDKFSRRRTHLKEKDVTYINDRNRIYNEKLQRNFGEYTKEIKSNLERGTAI